MTKKELFKISSEIIQCGIDVHSQLGPGLLESVYSECMVIAILKKGLSLELEKIVPITYDGIEIRNRLKLDILVEGCIIIELKAVEALLPVHTAQILTYMKLSKVSKGLLINFNTKLLKYGIKSFVNEYYAKLEEE